mmetsp:Transcript_8823/g.13581  ORF Transcript_8823/g.13581 Transcript_8823/m.13581 type:complete len:209 (+) Transcript_8823:589-1215(+)
MEGVSDLCLYRIIIVCPMPEALRSCDEIPFSPRILEIASIILCLTVTFPSDPLGRGWIHRLHVAKTSLSKRYLIISYFVNMSATSPSIVSFLVAGLLSFMASSSSSAAVSMRLMNSLASSSATPTSFLARAFFFILFTAAIIGFSGSPSNLESVSLRRAEPPNEDPFLFRGIPSSSESGLSSSKFCSLYNSLSASGSSPDVSMKSLSS